MPLTTSDNAAGRQVLHERTKARAAESVAETQLRCSACDAWKDDDQFAVDQRAILRRSRTTTCKECRRVAHRAWRKGRRPPERQISSDAWDRRNWVATAELAVVINDWMAQDPYDGNRHGRAGNSLTILAELTALGDRPIGQRRLHDILYARTRLVSLTTAESILLALDLPHVLCSLVVRDWSGKPQPLEPDE